MYGVVSSHEQKAKGDLERQNGRVLAYCVKQKYKVIKSYEEVGSGMCDTRAKLRNLFTLVSDKQIDRVIVEHKDRLTRFNFQFLEDFFTSYGVKIEWMEEVLGKKYEDELVEDMLTLMSSFSNKIFQVGGNQTGAIKIENERTRTTKFLHYGPKERKKCSSV